MYHKYSELFKELVRIEVVKRFPRSSRGRPVSLTFQDAWDSIILILRTGMQWRSLVPKTASYITVFKTMHLWMKSNVFKTAYTNLLRLYRIRRCQNVECGVVLHRDKNAARNIADNFLRLYAGKPPLKTLSREERKIEELMCSICL